VSNSRLALVYLLGFAGAIVVASYAGFRDFLPVLLEGTLVTIEITAMSAMVAVPCAVVAALAKIYGVLPLRWLAVAYIEIFRGTSALVQLFWLFFVLPHFGITLEPITAAVIGLGLNLGAYGAEVVRGAVQAVPRGQWEASTALNMTRAMALRRIVLPQAFVAMIPPWGNLFIELLKATSLVSLITITDLTFKAKGISDVTLRTAEVFNVALVIYLCIALVITYAMRTLERSATRGLARGRSA
jgi:polar amino acid transport system permease protein